MSDKFPIIPSIIMIILAFGMFYGQIQFKKKNDIKGRTLSIFCGLAITITAFIVNTYIPALDLEKLDARVKVLKAELLVLSYAVSEQYQGNGAKCLFIHAPLEDKPEDLAIHKELLNTVLKGFNGKVSEVRPIQIKYPLPGENPDLTTASHFNTVLQRNPDCDIVIISCSLPYDAEELFNIGIFELIKSDEDPEQYIKNPQRKYPLVGLHSSYSSVNIPEMGYFIDDGLIAVMTTRKPGANYSDELPEDMKSIFEKRFLLINKSNIDLVAQQFPKLFKVKKR